MALLSTQVLPDNTLEEFRIEFNKLVTDVSGLSLGNTFDTQIIFEGTTDDTFETALSVTDPTADRSIVFPNASGNVLLDSTNIALADSIEIQLGDGTDLKIFHDGSNSIIRDNGTGSLFLEGDAVVIRNAASNETMANFTQDGAVSLFHNNAVKIATASTGVTITGEATATGFTGTLDGILGSGTAAAATVTTLNTSGAVNLNLVTDSTSSTSGALIVDGGVGIAKKLFVGTDLDVDGTANLDVVDIDGAVNMATTALVTGVLTTTATQVATGGITSGSNIVSDTDSTDDLGTTGVRWANLYVDAITATDQITATGFTGTLDGILGSGTAAAATTTTLASTTITASGIIKTDDTTEATSTTDGSLQTDGGLSVAKDIVAGNDVKLLSDASILSFGADGDVTLTHVADTGLLLNSTMAIQFNDASQFIKGSSNAILDLGATDKIGLTATLIEVNGNQTTSGTYTGGGIIKTDDTTAATSTTDGSLQTDGGLSVAGDAVIGDDLLLLSDGAIMKFGADSEIVLTHVADAGLRFSDSDQLQFGTGGDLVVKHDGTNSSIVNSTGDLYISDAGGNIYIQAKTGEQSIAAFADGAVDLYHNNVKKLETTATGITVTGGIAGVTDINTGQIANRNAVQNGAMMVDQKGGTTTLSGYAPAKPDRYTSFEDNAGTQTVAQDSESPVGFNKSLKVTNTVVDSSIASGDRAVIVYRLEGNDAARFAFGGSDAKTVTLSFYVRSSITGTHGGALGNGADNRSYPFTYSISSANTWERKSVTIAGDTTGTWATDTGRSLQIVWSLGVGSTNSGTAGEWAAANYNSATGATTAFLTTVNATWYLTGVQLEEGSTATDFEHKSYAQEEMACRRYYTESDGDLYTGLSGFGLSSAAGAFRDAGYFPVPMRAAPTMAYTNLASGWSAANINSRTTGYTVELSKTTADARPNYQFTATAEM